MDSSFSPEEEQFRSRFQRYVEERLPEDYRGFYVYPERESQRAWDFNRRFVQDAARDGWMTAFWPKEFGGQGSSPSLELIMAEEVERYYEPRGPWYMALGLVSRTLMKYGSQFQQETFLPRIASGELLFCQCYTEPNAGSDLGALETKAVLRDGVYHIQGQKIFTSYAEHADWAFVLARTGRQEDKGRAVSMFLVDMKSRGVTVRPLRAAFGAHFNEVFFDDVQASPECLVGAENGAWEIVLDSLEHERLYLGWYCRDQSRQEHLADEWRRSDLTDDASRRALARMILRNRVSQLHCYSAWTARQKESSALPQVAAFYVWRYAFSRSFEAELSVLGFDALRDADDEYAQMYGEAANNWRWDLCGVGGGSAEVNRNIIASRALGLPRQEG